MNASFLYFFFNLELNLFSYLFPDVLQKCAAKKSVILFPYVLLTQKKCFTLFSYLFPDVLWKCVTNTQKNVLLCSQICTVIWYRNWNSIRIGSQAPLIFSFGTKNLYLLWRHLGSSFNFLRLNLVMRKKWLEKCYVKMTYIFTGKSAFRGTQFSVSRQYYLKSNNLKYIVTN